MATRWPWFLCTILFCTSVTGAEWLRFENINLDDGLSQLSITSAIQDEQGFMWLGTQSGLNRFDGYTFRVFRRRYNASEQALSDNYVSSLAAGPNGIIWIGTGSGGVARFDTRTERFEIHDHDPEDDGSLPGNEVLVTVVDRRGGLWVGLRDVGLAYHDPVTDRFERYLVGLPSQTVTSLALGENTLLVGTSEGPAFLALESGTAEPVTGIAGSVSALAHDPAGGWWVGTQAGLYRLSEDGEIQHRYRAGPVGELPSEAITALAFGRTGDLWIGTWDGLARLKAGSSTFERWRHAPLDEYSLAANRVASIVEDQLGVLWVGTWTGGISRVDPAAVVFDGERLQADGKGLPDAKVRDFVERDGMIWMATLGGGLARYNPEDRSFLQFRHEPFDPTSIASDQLHALALDNAGQLWVGSRDAGISRLNVGSGEAVGYPRLGNGDPESEPAVVLDILVDRLQNLWVATEGDGVWVLAIADGTWRHLSSGSGEIASNIAGHLFEDTIGRIWIGHRGAGISLYLPDKDRFMHLPPAPKDPRGLPHGTVTFIFETAQGEKWIATQGGGIARVAEPASNQFEFTAYSTADGLGGDAVGAVLVDERGEVWASTLQGISVLSPATGRIRNYFPLHGTQKRAYYVGAGLVASDGTLYFGGIEGVTLLNGHTQRLDERPPTTQVTGVFLFNRRLEAGASELPALPAPSYVERLAFNYRQNIFGIEFAGLHYTQPSGNLYQYQLVGFDEQWVDTPSDRRLATYTNLDPGQYRFRVRSANRDGAWSPVREIDIRIDPPPWETMTAYAAYSIGALCLLGLAGSVRGRQLAARREARRAIREGRERLDLALWGSGEEMWFVDLDSGRIERISHLDVKTERQVANLQELWDLMHPDDRSHVQEQMKRHLRGQIPFFEATYRMRGTDGQWIWALSKGRAGERHGDGRVKTVAGATKDVTQLKNTERALRELNERLEYMVDERTDDLRRTNDDLRRTLDMLTEAQAQLVESEKMASLGNLVAGVAHEINTPVGVALTAATYMESQVNRLLRELQGPEEMPPEQYRVQAEKQAENLRFLIQNLNRAGELIRSFKQVAVDQSSEDLRKFRVRAYVEEILTSLHPRFKRTRHEVIIECDPELEMESYPGALYQVLVNLLINSLDHAFDEEDAGVVSIEIAAAEDRVAIRYTDNGRGMTPEVSARIFEPFFTTRRGSGGSGLGMHIVYNLVNNVLGGKIACSGRPGAGIEVTLRLPRVIGSGVDD